MLRRRATILFIAAASAGAMVLNAGLKEFFGRARPDIVPHLVDVSTLSFPSGHAMLSAAVYLSLAGIVSQIAPSPRHTTYIMGAALSLTVLVGFSRVYLGVHYPTDVFVGWAVGSVWAILCWLAMALFMRARKRGSA
jgi:undecaprenyl-diphosphatase